MVALIIARILVIIVGLIGLNAIGHLEFGLGMLAGGAGVFLFLVYLSRREMER